MKVLLIEDEPLAAQRLKKMILELRPQYEILDILESVQSVIEWFRHHTILPDLLVMDIQLSDGLSFEIFQEIEIALPVIFTTAFDDYAIKAFKVNSIDYILKPIKLEELLAALVKFERVGRSQSLPNIRKALSQEQRLPKRFVLKLGGSIRTVEIADIAYCYTADKISFAMCFDGKRYPLDHNLEQIEELLDPAQFFRINRQMIVQFKAIKEIYTHTKSRVKVLVEPKSDQEWIVSTEKSSEFKEWLAGGQKMPL